LYSVLVAQSSLLLRGKVNMSVHVGTFLTAFTIGMGVWFLTYGLNRVFLLFKNIVS